VKYHVADLKKSTILLLLLWDRNDKNENFALLFLLSAIQFRKLRSVAHMLLLNNLLLKTDLSMFLYETCFACCLFLAVTCLP
jgi:hypothetical protein